MNLKLLTGCAALMVALLGPGKSGYAVTYNEAADGDLLAENPLPMLFLDLGVNTIKGTFGADASEVADFDAFAFRVPDGASVVAATLEIDDPIGNLGNNYWRLYEGSASLFQGTLVQIVELEAPGSIALPAPLGAGLYNFSHESFGYIPPAPTASNYTFTFQLVPEPATMGMALVTGAGVWRRRRNR